MTFRNKPDWPTPSDLRCLGGPADGKWFALPPADYVRVERRGGAVWLYIGPHEHPNYYPRDVSALPRSALPGESV